MRLASTNLLAFAFCLQFISACQNTNNPVVVSSPPSTGKAVRKPASSFSDTLQITSAAVVFYEPDSAQLQKIKMVTEPRVYEGSMHEYYSQVRNAHLFLKANWPALQIIDAKKIRFLRFHKSGNTSQLVDLDKHDPYGMFVFDGKRDAHLVDMMNVETEVPAYYHQR
jgi:hypothetical protein